MNFWLRFILLLPLILGGFGCQTQTTSLSPHLVQPLKFNGFTVSELNSDGVTNLLNAQVYIGFEHADPTDYDIFTVDGSTNRVRVESVQQYRDLAKDIESSKVYAVSTLDLLMQNYIEAADGVLSFMEKAQTSTNSFLDRDILKDLPVSILNRSLSVAEWDVSDRFEKILKADSERGKTIRDYHSSSAPIYLNDFERDNHTLRFYDSEFDADYYIQELARGDVDGDGAEDILVNIGWHAHEGTMGFSSLSVFTKTKAYQHQLQPINPESTAFPTNSPFGSLQEEQQFNDYTVRVYRVDDDNNTNENYGCLEILKAGKQIYFQPGFRFALKDIFDDESTNQIQLGQCITSAHQPNLVVCEWSGGSHCCYTYHVFEIGDTFRLLGSIEGRNSGVQFKDLRGDGNYRALLYDWTFEYWNACFADSPSPQVILCYQNGKYEPDFELMKKPVPSAQTLSAKASDIKAAFDGGSVLDPNNAAHAPTLLWKEMLDLIYSGNKKSAWKLMDLSWPVNGPSKDNFKAAFLEQLAQSPYYPYINQASFQE